jgi:protein-arginine kinase activator protein McsA
MICTRCEKHKAEVRLDLYRLDNQETKIHANLCEECTEEVIHLLYSCTCHIKEKGNGERVHAG